MFMPQPVGSIAHWQSVDWFCLAQMRVAWSKISTKKTISEYALPGSSLIICCLVRWWLKSEAAWSFAQDYRSNNIVSRGYPKIAGYPPNIPIATNLGREHWLMFSITPYRQAWQHMSKPSRMPILADPGRTTLHVTKQPTMWGTLSEWCQAPVG